MHEKKGHLGITFRNKCPKNKHHMSKNDYSTSYRDGLKQKIIDTALPLFKENGIKAVKMDDIATILGISKRTLYEIIGDKEHLLFECVKHDTEKQHAMFGEHARIAENEMDMLAFFLKIKLKDIGTVNPSYFTEMYKYDSIMDYLRKKGAEQRAQSIGFMKKGIEDGFFRDDLNYEIVHVMSDATISHVMQTEMYKRYDFKDIFRTFIFVHLRGCCTKKGLDYLEAFLAQE